METFDELYYREPYKKEFQARVVTCEQGKDGYEIELDQTAFYPLGGGQPGDRGTLTDLDLDQESESAQEQPAASKQEQDKPAKDGAPEAEPAGTVHVLDTVKKDDHIVHIADAPLTAGTRVHGQLDWTWRRDNMEAHTGEHVVSGIVHALYGYENVGFHMGERCIEVDFDGPLDDAQVLDIEQRANVAVRQDLPVQTVVPSPQELAQMDYRSKRELEGAVRIVSIPDIDACACCGVHVATTGQVGLIKILRAITKKKKTRLELLCGRRALEEAEQQQRQLNEISNFLTVGNDEAPEAVRRLSAERDALRHELRQAHHNAIDQSVSTMPKRDGLLIRAEEGFDIEELRYLAEQVLTHGAAQICAVLAPAENSRGKADAASRLNYVIASTQLDLRPACKELNSRLGGRGGGKPQMVQGSYAAGRQEAEAALHDVLG